MMRGMIRYTSHLQALIYLSLIALALLALACSPGSSETGDGPAVAGEQPTAVPTTPIDIAAPMDTSVPAVEAMPTAQITPEFGASEVVENVIMAEDVFRTLSRYGIRPEGVIPSVQATLANSAFFAAVGKPVPEEFLDPPSLIFLVNEDAHDDLEPDAPRPLLNIDGRGAYEPLSVSVQISSSHHRAMMVSYALNGPDGKPLIGPNTRSLELVFRGDKEDGTGFNELRWNLPIVYAEGVQSRDVTPELSDSDDILLSMIRRSSPYEGELELAVRSVESDVVVWVELTDEGSTLETLRIPYGKRVALVMRNTGVQEHHFHIMRLETDVLLWYAKKGTVVSGEPRDMNMGEMGVGMDDADEDKEYFISSGELVRHHVCNSESGICPTGDWVHAHANPGNWDFIVFVPAERGTFEAVDPLHPDITVEVIVF